MYWEAGVGANWECIGRRGRSELGMYWEAGFFFLVGDGLLKVPFTPQMGVEVRANWE